MELTIQEVARLSGISSRALRHYASIGLLAPSRIGSNGYRHYDQDALVRLQRILLLRELGLRLPAIAEVVDGALPTGSALRIHLDLLITERARIERQIASVRTTLRKTEGGEEMMAEEIFDGFDHTRYREEVEQRWGADAYANSAAWWSAMSVEEQKAFQQTHVDIAADWGRLHAAGRPVDSPDAQAVAARHVQWLSGPVDASREYVANIGDMYVADERFGRHYDRHGAGTAAYVRDALRTYATSM